MKFTAIASALLATAGLASASVCKHPSPPTCTLSNDNLIGANTDMSASQWNYQPIDSVPNLSHIQTCSGVANGCALFYTNPLPYHVYFSYTFNNAIPGAKYTYTISVLLEDAGLSQDIVLSNDGSSETSTTTVPATANAAPISLEFTAASSTVVLYVDAQNVYAGGLRFGNPSIVQTSCAPN
ncbi:hypothetical protein Sste5346_005211 [Sporothrix stenoceras]|uniref:Uncharacterized protein n=1 Tax=Sporothrix stenoceras TaxID=5173 RepID=A0ABR3Z452_9PEZI